MKKQFLGYIQELKDTLDKIDLETFEKVNELLFDTLENNKHIFTMGNGGSGLTASHLVCDLNKGVCYKQSKKFQALCLNDNIAIVLAYANDVSYSDIFHEQLKNYLHEGDIVIGFSGSGNSENVLKAFEYANQNRGITIGFSGYDGGKLAKLAKYSIVAPVNDMQISEDVHLILTHMIMQSMERLLSCES